VSSVPVDAAGPVPVARRWISAVMDEDDWQAAWAITDDVLRLAHVQAWLWPNRAAPELVGEDLDDLAAEMCEEGPEHPLWDEFAEMALYTYNQIWLDFDPVQWSLAGRPRPVAPDLEVVVFARAEADPIIETSANIVVARPFLMRYVDGSWLVAHAGSDQLPVPGWPPEFPSATTQP
jgi:hypothetical protein